MVAPAHERFNFMKLRIYRILDGFVFEAIAGLLGRVLCNFPIVVSKHFFFKNLEK